MPSLIGHFPAEESNLRKGTRVEGRDPESEMEIRLFHPRRDKWDEHFQVDVESGTITGTTAMGRATIVCLDFNNQMQIMARQLWRLCCKNWLRTNASRQSLLAMQPLQKLDTRILPETECPLFGHLELVLF